MSEPYDDPFAAQRAALDEHAKLIGNVTIAWNTAQSLVFAIFSVMSRIAPESDNAAAIFFALKSDIAQRDITTAVIESELGTSAHPEHKKLAERLKRPIHKLNSLSAERNAAIHTMWSFVSGDEHENGRVLPSSGVIHNPVLDINDAAGQFERLEAKLGSVIDALLSCLTEAREFRAWLTSQDTPDPRHDRRRGKR